LPIKLSSGLAARTASSLPPHCMAKDNTMWGGVQGRGQSRGLESASGLVSGRVSACYRHLWQ
jgi:hypothetical protein